MEQPVLVRAYTGNRVTTSKVKGKLTPSLPPISAYAFADIVRSADGPEFQSAIEGIVEICAKSRLSLAEEYAAHRPPVGEITEASSRQIGPHLRKPGMARALTSVPEGSSGSSEGSRRSKRRNIFGFRTREETKIIMPRVIRIGSMGRSITVSGTTAVASDTDNIYASIMPVERDETRSLVSTRNSSAAAISLQRLLSSMESAPD